MEKHHQINWLNCFLIYHSTYVTFVNFDPKQRAARYNVVGKIIKALYQSGVKTALIFPGKLLKLFAKESPACLEFISQGLQAGQFTLIDTAFNFIYLPLFNTEVLANEVKQQQRIRQKLFPHAPMTQTFYPPLLGIDPKVVGVLSKLGYRYILADELMFYDQVELRSSEVLANGDLSYVTLARVFQNYLLSSSSFTKLRQVGEYLLPRHIRQVTTVSDIYDYHLIQKIAADQQKEASLFAMKNNVGSFVEMGKEQKLPGEPRLVSPQAYIYNSRNPLFPYLDRGSLVQQKIIDFTRLVTTVDTELAGCFDAYHHVNILGERDALLAMISMVYQKARERAGVAKKRRLKTGYEDLIFSYLDNLHTDDFDRPQTEYAQKSYQHYTRRLPGVRVPTPLELMESKAQAYQHLLLDRV